MDRTKEDIKRDVVDELYRDYSVDAFPFTAAVFTAGVVKGENNIAVT